FINVLIYTYKEHMFIIKLGGNKLANRDGRGPLGMGPRTGKRLGYCSGTVSDMSRFGLGYGYGRMNRYTCGRGYQNRFRYNNVNFNNTYYIDKNMTKNQLMEEKSI